MMDKGEMLNEIDRRFKHYAPKNEEEIKVHEIIREKLRYCAKEFTMSLPMKVVNSREFAMFLTDLENAMMHANAAYARHKSEE